MTSPIRDSQQMKAPTAVAKPPVMVSGQHGPGGGIVKPPAKPPTSGPTMTSGQKSVYDLLADTLNQWGLSSLVPDLKNLVISGVTSNDSLALALQQTQAYKDRFKGNEIRRKLGLPELTPAQYVATEAGYKQTLMAAGLPPGFYDQHDDFANMIGYNLSPNELQQRVQIAHDEYMNAPQATRDLWTQYYGKGDILASLLDPEKATAVIQDRANQVAIGGEAAKNGFAVNQARAQQMQQAGVSIDQARQAYQRIGQVFGTDQAIASRFGQQFGQTQEENDLLLGNGQAGNMRAMLYDSEQGLFRGHGAVDANALSQPSKDLF